MRTQKLKCFVHKHGQHANDQLKRRILMTISNLLGASLKEAN